MRNFKTIAVATTAAIALTTTSAFAADALISSKDIKDQGIMNRDIRRGTVSENRLDRGVRAKLNKVVNGTNGSNGSAGTQGPKGNTGARGPQGSSGVTNLESDGPYPGATQLQQGANSTAKFVAGQNNTLQRAWVQCAPGKTAIGGGFSRADEGDAAVKGLQIVSSQPTQIENGAEVYHPIAGDVDGSFVPNAWLVEGYNNGNTDLIVRPHVVCANVS